MSSEFLGWLQAIQIVFTLGLAVYTWRARQESARNSQVKSLEVASGMQDREIALIKQRLEAMPCDAQCKTFQSMQTEIASLKSTVNNQNGWLSRLSSQLDRIDNWLRENK